MELFYENETYNPKGLELDSEATDLLKPLIEKWHDKGYKLRDICSVLQDTISIESNMILLNKRTEE